MDITAIIDENYRLKQELEAYQSISLDDIRQLASLSNKMGHLLEKCRNEQIDFRLAKEIDQILEEVKKLG